MVRGLLGGLAALLLVAAGAFWWQGRAETAFGGEAPALPVESAPEAEPEGLPSADADGLTGVAPPEANAVGREARRFNGLDKDRDSRISRTEMLSPRASAFRKLDKDGNNLLTFEEWAVTTVDRFKSADNNADLFLTREEFATTRPKDKPKPKPKCSCK
ncbi:EF-hand domain-containing protein [Novosphingobium sp. SL115]|uniref:EF-hand domain-containing protein n=1 Tax=Novosphingobium sp. SL115 TaxID=2995150 RepID=UPI0022723478|nr:EF-hand domain-containing protein [Novosphingobium sp. SL115]MCY1671758.1 EF-hand domain-containing protein [Novosphingobium sp. SL115]